jgi:hypothetical protein
MKYSIWTDIVGIAWPVGLTIFFCVSDHQLTFGMVMGMVSGMIAGMRIHNIITHSV